MRQFVSLALASVLAFACAKIFAADFTFAAFGDAPYSRYEENRFIEVIAEMNREPLEFAVHVGDFKSGWSACTDELFEQRREWFALSRHPLIYVPGDNEWTDCWRAFGDARDPLERLRKLRALFHADDFSLGQRKIKLVRQNAEYPEHARWVFSNVLFAALNVPGGDNNRGRMPDEATARGNVLTAWIELAFRTARGARHAGVVLLMQANPWSRNGQPRTSYRQLLEVIARETLSFDGEVLMIHGDTHRYRVDKPLMHPQTGGPIGNFTRAEVHGSPEVNWLRVRVNSRNGRPSFLVTPGS
jgi:hypothetical protein